MRRSVLMWTKRWWGVTESRGPKSDKRDAYGLAEKFRVGGIDKRVFKAPGQFTRPRELSRIHMTRVGDVIRVQSRIKSLYRSRGVMVSGLNVYSVRLRDDWQKQLGSSAQTRAARLYDQLDFLVEQKKHAEGGLALLPYGSRFKAPFSWVRVRE
jgi:hypothetical protein